MRWHGSPMYGFVTSNTLRSVRNNSPLLAEQTSLSWGPPLKGAAHCGAAAGYSSKPDCNCHQWDYNGQRLCIAARRSNKREGVGKGFGGVGGVEAIRLSGGDFRGKIRMNECQCSTYHAVKEGLRPITNARTTCRTRASFCPTDCPMLPPTPFYTCC